MINQKDFYWLFVNAFHQTTEKCDCWLLTLVTQHHYAALN